MLKLIYKVFLLAVFLNSVTLSAASAISPQALKRASIHELAEVHLEKPEDEKAAAEFRKAFLNYFHENEIPREKVQKSMHDYLCKKTKLLRGIFLQRLSAQETRRLLSRIIGTRRQKRQKDLMAWFESEMKEAVPLPLPTDES